MVAGSHQCHYETQWQWLQALTSAIMRLSGNGCRSSQTQDTNVP